MERSELRWLMLHWKRQGVNSRRINHILIATHTKLHMRRRSQSDSIKQTRQTSSRSHAVGLYYGATVPSQRLWQKKSLLKSIGYLCLCVIVAPTATRLRTNADLFLLFIWQPWMPWPSADEDSAIPLACGSTQNTVHVTVANIRRTRREKQTPWCESQQFT